MSDLISVIIPAYNAGKFIKSTLESVINQDYENIEIILVDDVCTDNTMKIAEDVLKNSGRKFKIIHHEVNKGTCTARNTGLKNASGKYLNFMDHDDLLRKNFLSSLYNAISNNDFVFCGIVDKFQDKKIKRAPLKIGGGYDLFR